MKHHTDKELAAFLLEMRQHEGRSQWARQMKANRGSWILFFTFILALLILGVFLRSVLVCGFVVGMVVGIFSRDSTWLQHQRLAWPFYAKVTDWAKVERIARGEAAVEAG